jgi:hypothetical protein
MKTKGRILPLIVFTFLLTLFTYFDSIASTNQKNVIDTGTIQQQFRYVINKSTRYNDYRAVRSAWLSKLNTNVNDTLNYIKFNLETSGNLIQNQTRQIDSLTLALSETQNNLTITTREKNSIRFLGFLMGKTYYNTMVWMLIASLSGILVVLFIAYKRSHVVTVKTKHELLETKEEFELHRKRAREREEKLARRHLDELLKYKYKGNQVSPTKKNQP